MDAHAHLVSLGWAGTGYSLDARPYKQKGHRGLAYDPKSVRSTGEGLVKPLLISHRAGRFGVGSKKAHEPASGNQWWLKGFESALNNIGKSESERSSASGTATPELSTSNGRHLGLYSFFVRGQEMEGTLDKDGALRGKKRKSDVLDEVSEGKPVYRRKRESTTEFEQVNAFIGARDRDEKRRQPNSKLDATAEFRQIGQFFAQKDKSNQRSGHSAHDEAEDEAIPQSPSRGATDTTTSLETKEERRERRRRRREARAAKAGSQLQPPENSDNVQLDQAVDVSKEKRRRNGTKVK